MRYEVIHDVSHEKIVERVNKKIEERWEPLGGISTCPEFSKDGVATGFILYSQAIFRRV
jgi:hypothetical protein